MLYMLLGMKRIRIAVLGAGNHSRNNHLPALARFVAEHPGRVELAALCDLDEDKAERAAGEFGFDRVYTDLDRMLREVSPDGCIAVTPIALTAQIAGQIIRTGVPLLMEKPPGVSAKEARETTDLVESAGTPVMVSMNRRYDPALRAALSWKGGRPVEYARATMIRHGRDEPGFMLGTAIHPLDAMRFILGNVTDFSSDSRDVGGVPWTTASFRFESGSAGTLEVLPTGGCGLEAYELFGADYRIRVIVGADRGDTAKIRCWQSGELVVDEDPAAGKPPFVRNGTYGETVEFITSLREGRPPHPSPADVLQSVELCEALISPLSA